MVKKQGPMLCCRIENDELEQIDTPEEEGIAGEETETETADTSNKTEAKKGFGKLFWIMLFLFVIVTAGGIYYFLFYKDTGTASLKGNLIDSTKIQTQPVAPPPETIEQKNNTAETDTVEKIIPLAQQVSDTWKYDPSKKEQLFRKFENDSEVRNNIYFDGNKYNVQISSWRSRTIAMSEAQRIRESGFRACISEVNLPQLGGRWYRIRIIFFNTVDEAQAFLIEHKNL